MRYIISITRDATNFKINKKKHQSVFEVFGFDFMIDRTFKVKFFHLKIQGLAH